jgi:hypothetical protein
MIPVNHAIELAGDGFATFPCLSTKAPASPHGFKDASTDAYVIRALWQRYPGELVGIATGDISNLVVLDMDAKHAQARGWWAANRARLPWTRAVRTRSGGIHLWFLNEPGLRCSVGAIAPGVDVRASGGYIIAWHVAGFPMLREAPLAPWPNWLLAPTPRLSPRINKPPHVPDDKQTAALVRFVALSPEHQRNNRLFWAACRMAEMVTSRLLAARDAEDLLVHAAVHAGLSETESRRTTLSGFATAGVN